MLSATVPGHDIIVPLGRKLAYHSLIPCFLSHKEVVVHAGGRLLTLGAHAQRGLQYLVCHSVCLSVCLSVRHAILAVRATKSITKYTIVLSVRFAAILK